MMTSEPEKASVEACPECDRRAALESEPGDQADEDRSLVAEERGVARRTCG